MLKIWKTLELLPDSVLNKNVGYRDWNSQNDCQISSEKTLISIQQSDCGLHSLSMPFDRNKVFEILKHLPFNCKS